MKNKITILIMSITLVAIVFMIINWRSLLFNIAGIKEPKIENAQSIKSWSELKTHHDLLVVSSTKENFNHLQENIGVPGILVFNKEGILILSNRGEGCQITARSKLKDLGTTARPDSLNQGFAKLADLLKKVDVISNSKLYNEKEYDYTVVYTWAKYLPKHSREMMEAVNHGLSKNNTSVLLISMNLDYIDIWAEGSLGDKIDFD